MELVSTIKMAQTDMFMHSNKGFLWLKNLLFKSIKVKFWLFDYLWIQIWELKHPMLLWRMLSRHLQSQSHS